MCTCLIHKVDLNEVTATVIDSGRGDGVGRIMEAGVVKIGH